MKNVRGTLKKLSTPRWIVTTLLVLAAAGVMVRLGIWQLDRLAQRKALNASTLAVLNAPALNLNRDFSDPNLESMKYRSVVVTGHYDLSQQVGLRNQVWNGQIGADLLTPLKIDGTDQVVLINRGWIPFADASSPQNWGKYDETGTVTVRGMILPSQARPVFGSVVDPTLAPGQTRLDLWNTVNVERIASQANLTMLPVYIQEAPVAGRAAPPQPSLPAVDLTDGPHLNYAIQWFSFAAILLAGYPFFVLYQLKKIDQKAGKDQLVDFKYDHQYAASEGLAVKDREGK